MLALGSVAGDQARADVHRAQEQEQEQLSMWASVVWTRANGPAPLCSEANVSHEGHVSHVHHVSHVNHVPAGATTRPHSHPPAAARRPALAPTRVTGSLHPDWLRSGGVIAPWGLSPRRGCLCNAVWPNALALQERQHEPPGCAGMTSVQPDCS